MLNLYWIYVVLCYFNLNLSIDTVSKLEQIVETKKITYSDHKDEERDITEIDDKQNLTMSMFQNKEEFIKSAISLIPRDLKSFNVERVDFLNFQKETRSKFLWNKILEYVQNRQKKGMFSKYITIQKMKIKKWLIWLISLEKTKDLF